MAEISNKALALLLIIAIVVSVGGAMINVAQLIELTRFVPLLQITGMPTVGTVNITVSSQVAINLTQYEVDFGPGYVSGGTAARLNTSSGSLGKENWTIPAGYTYLPNNLTVENVGNRNCSVNFTSDKNGTELVSNNITTTPVAAFQFKGVNKDSGTCSSDNLTSTYIDISNPATADDSNTIQNNLCGCMRFEEANDELFVNFQVIVPETAIPGAKNATLTFTASDWSSTNKVC